MEIFQNPDLFVIMVKGKALDKPTPIEVCMYCTTEEMQLTGGSFVKMLGMLWQLADPSNKRLILSSWLDKYVIEYAVAANQRRGTVQCDGH